jgi:unspecific monooxygenase
MVSAQMHNISGKVMYGRLVPWLESAAAKDSQTDVLELSYRLCSDYISSFLFGYSNGTNFLSADPNSEQLNMWRRDYENHMCDECFFPQEMPGVYKFLKSMGVNLVPKRYMESKKNLESWMMKMASKADQTIHNHRVLGQPVLPEDQPVVYEAAKVGVQKDSPHLDSKAQNGEVASEMFDHICKSLLLSSCGFVQAADTPPAAASREVLGLVLAYTFWYIAQNPHVQQRIRAELAAAEIDMSAVPSPVSAGANLSGSLPTALDKLPYLGAVINESLRMRPTSTLLPRITPPDRTVSVAGIDDIPPNTRINASRP